MNQSMVDRQARIDAPLPTFAAIWVAVVGVIAYMFLPLMLGGLADDLGFTNKQLGFIGAAEAAGMGIANAVAVFWIRRSNWRTIIVWASLLMIVSNLASMLISTFPLMLAARLVDGFAGGALIALGVACQSDNSNADRVFGYFVATEMLFSSVGFVVLPVLSVSFGVDGVFGALAVISLTGMAVATVHPKQGTASRESDTGFDRKAATSFVSIAALTGALLFFMSQGGLWAFVERIAIASELSAQQIGNALAISSIAGIIGALGANWISTRVGELRAFAFVLIGEVLCIYLLFGQLSVLQYAVAASMFIFFWAMALPLMLSLFNRLDSTGQLVVLLYAMTKLGYALGPAMMGLMVADNDFGAVLVTTAILCVAGLSISVWLSGGRFDKNVGGIA